jgi:hypothetical protein
MLLIAAVLPALVAPAKPTKTRELVLVQFLLDVVFLLELDLRSKSILVIIVVFNETWNRSGSFIAGRQQISEANDTVDSRGFACSGSTSKTNENPKVGVMRLEAVYIKYVSNQAAFGLQRKQQYTDPSDRHKERPWDNAARFLPDKVRASPSYYKIQE